MNSEQNVQPLDNSANGTKPVLSAMASIEQIEEVARQYFEVKYPLMDLSNDEDKCEIDWWDMLQFVQHVSPAFANAHVARCFGSSNVKV